LNNLQQSLQEATATAKSKSVSLRKHGEKTKAGRKQKRAAQKLISRGGEAQEKGR